MRQLWLLSLLILIGCNVANEPAVQSGATDTGGSGSTTPSISFTTGAMNRVEGSGIASLPFTMSTAATEQTDINISFSGTAVGGAACTGAEDYITPALPITLLPGDASGVVDIIMCNDSLYEGNETLTVTFGTITPAHRFGRFATATISISESLPVPQISFATASSGSVPEGSSGFTTIPVNVQLSHMSSMPISVQISSSGTATYGVDYTLSSSTVTFAPNSNSATFFVTIFGDDIIEPNENISLGFYAPFNASLGTQSTHDVQIAQDETPSALQASMAVAAAVNETATTQYLTVNLTGTLDHAAILNFTVDFASAITATQRATYPNDFTLPGQYSSSGYISVPAGATSVTIPVAIVNDALYEPSEGIVIRLLGGPEVSVATGFESTELVINQNDTANRPLISFQTSAQSLNESNTSGSVVIRLLDPAGTGAEIASGEDVVVTLTTNAQTTEGALDWMLGASSITIPAGSTRVTVPVTIVQDGVDEDDEYFDITLTPPAGYSAGANSTHRVTILDVDAASRASFQLASSSMTETAGPGTISVNVVLDKPSERTVTVNYSVTGSVVSSTGACGGTTDVTAPGTLAITPGLTTMALSSVMLCPDSIYEGTETAIFTMTSVTNGILGSPIIHTLSISDDEVVPSIDISSSSLSPAENGGDITLTATITNAVTTQQALIIPVVFTGTAVKGTHYNYTTAAISIPAGGTSGTMTVSILDNALYGGNKTLNADLSAGAAWSIGTGTAAMTITEDETLPEVGFSVASVTVAESAGAQVSNLRVNPGFAACEGAISISLSRAGTATYGADHDFQHPSAGIAAQGTSTNLGYNIINDMLYEPGGNETIIVTITSATCNGVALTLNPAVQTISISDDDPTPVVGYSLTAANVSENTTSVSITISMDRPSSQAVNATSSLVAYTPAPASTTDVNDAEYFKASVPGDLSLGSSAITIPAGVTSVTQTLTVVNDGIYEYSETAQMQLSGVTGATLSASHSAIALTILDNDAAPYAHVTFSNNPAAMTSSVTVAENSGTVSTVYALLTNTPGNGGTAYATAVPVRVPITLGGTAAAVTGSTYSQDYTLTVLGTSGGTLIVPAGASETSFTVTPVNDTIYENAETAIFTSGTIVNGQSSGSFPSSTLNISIDADSPPNAAISQTYTSPVEEKNSTVSFVVTVQPVGRQVTLSYTPGGTATAGTDHSLTAGSITVNPSTSVQTFPVLFQIIDDSVAEPIETITATISGADINAVTPTATIQIAVSDPLQIGAGNNFTCGLLDGVVKCWGYGYYLGRGSNSSYGGSGQPVSSLPGIDLGTGWVTSKLAVGGQHACALSTAGKVKCWGNNSYGQLGLDTQGSGTAQYIGDAAGEMGDNLNAVAIGENVTDIAAGYNHTCAVTVTGRMKCWGDNTYGQVGQVKSGSGCSTSTVNTACYGDHPGEVSGMAFISAPNGTFNRVAAGGLHTCASTDSNLVYCFGYNGTGALGRNDNVATYGTASGDMTNTSTFLPVGFHSNFASAQVVNVITTYYNSCAVLDTGVVEDIVCWGWAGYGLPGQGNSVRTYGTATFPVTTLSAAVEVNGFGGAFNTISGSSSYMSICVRGENGDAVCWGDGSSYQLGTNSTAAVGDGAVGNTLGDDSDGALVPGTWTNVASGYAHSCGVISHNQFKCWGSNGSYALGVQSNNGTEANVSAISAQNF